MRLYPVEEDLPPDVEEVHVVTCAGLGHHGTGASVVIVAPRFDGADKVDNLHILPESETRRIVVRIFLKIPICEIQM